MPSRFRSSFPALAGALLLGACASAPVRLAGETDAHCIHRLYDYPNRFEPFPSAASDCAGHRPLDLTGDRYYQELASSLNVPFVSRDPKRDQTIIPTGSRFPQSTSEPAPPELQLR